MSEHWEDMQEVNAFAEKMKRKLSASFKKGRHGWRTCEPDLLRKMLKEHVEKGDPVDVANFCMMLSYMDEGTK